MKFMHSCKMTGHPNVTNCLLEENPFHEYVVRVTELVGANFILNVVINRERQVAGVFAGHYDHLPGLIIPSGSNAFFIPRSSCRSLSQKMKDVSFSFSSPTPCSPLMVPPAYRQAR
ncbi:MAG: hypothetical protein DRP09_21770 [Candidatus Thorarchaeota archaeon]|nr:MAG: hypothetical protein DRP09_21770 [Candidatus Thorarchaeota archaeon]